ncbi:MAG: cyclic nucleotide-binding domain-containing protein, partial [Desulfuromonadales bacterium]|nr:cyclic nucleotide-binding domain-containing protein [Desulfuromonadales bacterium]
MLMKMIELFAGWEDQVEYPKGAHIFSEGDPADVMYVVMQGEVEVFLKGEPLGAELPGGIIGEMAMINAKYRSATAVALRPSTLARVNHQQFRD